MATETVLIDFQVDYTELTNAQAELAKTGKIDTKGFDAIQAAIDTTATDTKGLIKTFKDVAGASIKMGKTVEDAFGAGIQDALDEAGVSVEEFGAALKKANAPATTLKKELAQLKESMARMKAEGKDTGKEFDSLRARAGKLSDAIADANAEIKNAGSDTSGIDNVIGSVSALAGGYSALQGAAALFGEESEDLQKALLKVNAAMALATGVQQFYNATLKEGSLRKLADVIGTKAQSAALSIRNFVMEGSIRATEKSIASTVFSADAIKNYSSAVSGATNTQKLYETAVKSTTAATAVNTTATTAATASARAFRIALLATGIGVIVLLLVAAADAMGLFSSKTGDAVDKTKELADGLKNLNTELNNNLEAIRRNGDLQLEYLKQRGATEAQIFNKSQALIKAESQALLRNALERIKILGVEELVRTKQDADNLLSIKTRLAANKNISKKNKELFDEQINGLQQVSDAFKRISDNDAAIILNNERFKTKAAEDARKKQEEFDKKRLEALKKALKDAEDQQRVADANAIKAALDRVNKEIEAERIKYDNFEDMRAQEAAKRKKDAEDWDKQWKAFQESLVKSSEDAADKMRAAEKAAHEQRIKNAQISIEIANQVAGILNTISQQKTDNDRREIESERNKLNEQLKAGAITQKQYDMQQKRLDVAERKARQRQAEREKQAAVFQAVLAIPKAFLQGLSQGGIYLAAVYAALAAAEAAIIISKPVPKFFRGKKDSYAGPGIVGDMGSELVERDGRMYLYTKPTQTYLGANDKVYTASETRNIMHNTNVNTTIRQPKQERFDYDRLGKAIPRDSITINVDKDYISEAVANGLSKNNYFTSRYQFKK